jgi:hypothetical protein
MAAMFVADILWILARAGVIGVSFVRRPKRKVPLQDAFRKVQDPIADRRRVYWSYTRWRLGVLVVLLNVILLWFGVGYIFNRVSTDNSGFSINQYALFRSYVVRYGDLERVLVSTGWYWSRYGSQQAYTRYSFFLRNGGQTTIPEGAFAGKSLQFILDSIAVRRIPIADMSKR